jgi:superfamily II DNA or RNA helicase
MSEKKPFYPSEYRRILAEECQKNSEKLVSKNGKVQYDLEPHQKGAMEDISEALDKDVDRMNVVHSCGAGKTHLEVGILQASQRAKERMGDGMKNTQDVILTTERSIVEATRKLIESLGLDVGVWADGKKVPDRPILFASIQSIVMSRKELDKHINPNLVSLVIGDEADQYLTKAREQALDLFPHATRFGFTATDHWGDGRHIKQLWGETVDGLTLEEGIRTGINAKPLFSVYKADIDTKNVTLSKIESERDYERRSMGQALKEAQIEGSIHQIYNAVVPPEQVKDFPTLVFVPTVELVRDVEKKLKELYPDLSIRSWTGRVGNGERRRQEEDFRGGKVDILVLCDMGGRGLDLPNARCIIDAYPTLSANRLQHRHGRALRRIREGSEFHKRGFKKPFAHIVQILPTANTFKPMTLLDILDYWDEYDPNELIDFSARGGDSPQGAEPKHENSETAKEVRQIKQRMKENPPEVNVEQVDRVDVLKRMLEVADLPMVDEDGFIYKDTEADKWLKDPTKDQKDDYLARYGKKLAAKATEEAQKAKEGGSAAGNGKEGEAPKSPDDGDEEKKAA